MLSYTVHCLPCKCLAKIELHQEYWRCSECLEPVKPHQLREWPKLENGEALERPKDQGQKPCLP